MKKHTPGPWKVINRPCLRIIPNSMMGDERTLADVGPGWHEDNVPEAEANAALIAAAPELLEACQLALNYLETQGAFSDGHAYPALLRAIAQAEGRKK